MKTKRSERRKSLFLKTILASKHRGIWINIFYLNNNRWHTWTWLVHSALLCIIWITKFKGNNMANDVALASISSLFDAALLNQDLLFCTILISFHFECRLYGAYRGVYMFWYAKIESNLNTERWAREQKGENDCSKGRFNNEPDQIKWHCFRTCLAKWIERKSTDVCFVFVVFWINVSYLHIVNKRENSLLFYSQTNVVSV